MIVIWAIKKEEDYVKQKEAARFIEQVDKLKNIELCIPTPVVTEILSPYKADQEKYLDILAEIGSDYRIMPFDFKSSVVAAQLLNEYGKDPELKEMLRNEGFHKNIPTKIKFDIQIVSIAIAHDMQGIISEERNAILTYANGRIPVLTMDKFFNEGTLFEKP